MKIYCLWLCHSERDDYDEQLIRCYASESDALSAMDEGNARLKTLGLHTESPALDWYKWIDLARKNIASTDDVEIRFPGGSYQISEIELVQ